MIRTNVKPEKLYGSLVILNFIFFITMSVSCNKSEPATGTAWFLGNWLVSETCPSATVPDNFYRIEVKRSDENDDIIVLFNIGALGSNFGLRAMVEKDSFIIFPQEILGHAFSGSGYINNRKDSIYYQWHGGPNGFCTAQAQTEI